MDYLEFHRRWQPFGCFNVQQIYAWMPGFNRSNLSVWTRKGLLVKLRKEHYAFADCLGTADFAYYVANRIYRPSYVSLHTALAFYGIIPEAVVQVTSVSTLKTARFRNAAGDFFYQNMKPGMMFGYEAKPLADGRSLLFATPEKALLDLLYLNPYYQTPDDMLELRLDEDFMADDFCAERFEDFARRSESKALSARAHTLLKTYGLCSNSTT